MTDREQALEMARKLCGYDIAEQMWTCDSPSKIADALLETRAQECEHTAILLSYDPLIAAMLTERAATLRAQIRQEAARG